MDELTRHRLMTVDKLIPGARVKICARHLRNTGQFYGPDAPTHAGPWARGEITHMDAEYLPGTILATVEWDNGKTLRVLPSNLWPCGTPEPA